MPLAGAIVLCLNAASAAGQIIDCSNHQCSFFTLDARLFAARGNGARLEVGAWDEQHRVWRAKGSFVIRPGLDVSGCIVFDDRSAEVLLYQRDEQVRFELWRLDLEPAGTFTGQRVWNWPFEVSASVDVHRLPDGRHLVRTDSTLWIVDERAQRRVASADGLGFQSILRGNELAVSTANGVELFRRTGSSSWKQVHRMRGDGWVKHVGAIASGWVFTEVVRERKGVLTSPDLERVGNFDFPSMGTWLIASFQDGSILYSDESADAWVIRSSSDVRNIRWSGTAPIGQVAAGRSLDSLWLTNGIDVHRPVSERVVPVHTAAADRLWTKWFLTLGASVAAAYGWWRFLTRNRRPDEGGFEYVYVQNSGTVRELSPAEQTYLLEQFHPADGNRPHIKTHYRSKTPDGRLSGYLRRRQVPPHLTIGPAPPADSAQHLTPPQR